MSVQNDREISPITGDFLPGPRGSFALGDVLKNKLALTYLVPLGTWEGDPGIGHRFGELARAGDTADTRLRLADLARQAAQWLIDAGDLLSVDVNVESGTQRGQVLFEVDAYPPGGAAPISVGPFFVAVGGPLTIALPPSNNGSCWFLPDVQQSGIYTGVQLRVFRNAESSGPSWLANQEWFDRNLDSPYHPANRGGGMSFNSLPNDLSITGDWGYADADLPEPLLHATKVLAAFYTLRPASLLADVAITPSGGVLNYAQMPPEVANTVMGFVSLYGIGEQAVAVG